MKRLLEMLLKRCLETDFKYYSYCLKRLRNQGICGVIEDLENDSIITKIEYIELLVFIDKNRPENTLAVFWYEKDEQGNQQRIEFLRKLIKTLE